jgi:hypothetical protein
MECARFIMHRILGRKVEQYKNKKCGSAAGRLWQFLAEEDIALE